MNGDRKSEHEGSGSVCFLEIDMSNHLDKKRIPLFPSKKQCLRYLYYGS